MLKNKILLFVLVIMLVLSVTLIGCTKAEDEAVDTKPAETKKTEDDVEEVEVVTPSEPVHLTWLMGGADQPEHDMAWDHLNAMTKEKLNITVETLIMDGDAVKLAMQTGETWDIAFTCGWYNNYAVGAFEGYFADITELVQTETPDLYATMPEVVWEGAKVDGKLYAVPVNKDYAAMIYWVMDKTLFVDTLGMEIPGKMAFADIEPFAAAALEETGEYPFHLTKGGFSLTDNYDMINRTAMLGIPYADEGSTTVELIMETADYVNIATTVHDWFEKGYINPDAPTLEAATVPHPYIWSGQGFYGADAIWSNPTDEYYATITMHTGPNLSTASIRGAMNGFNVNTEFLTEALLYTEYLNVDRYYRDSLRYGIEGTHWDYAADGTIEKTDQGAKGYAPWAFSQGSYVNSTPTFGSELNMWDVIADDMSEAYSSVAIGFSFDTEPVKAIVASLQVINDKYAAGLGTGYSDPAVVIPEYIAELEAAGIREVQAECQKQLDAFLAK